MNTYTEKTNELLKENAEIVNNLLCIDRKQLNTPEFEMLTRNLVMLGKIQTTVIKQNEQNAKLLETLKETVNDLLDALNGKYKFI